MLNCENRGCIVQVYFRFFFVTSVKISRGSLYLLNCYRIFDQGTKNVINIISPRYIKKKTETAISVRISRKVPIMSNKALLGFNYINARNNFSKLKNLNCLRTVCFSLVQ